MCHWLRKIFFVLLTISFASTHAIAYPVSHLNHFLTISDIHFDPFANCSESTNKCLLVDQLVKTPYIKWGDIFNRFTTNIRKKALNQETTYNLLISRLNNLKMQHLKPSFMLVLGDFLAHGFLDNYKKYTGDFSLKHYQTFVNKTFMFLSQQLKQTFPNTPIYPLIGNNDSYRGDYYNSPDERFYKFLTTDTAWGQLFFNKANKQHFKQMFQSDGYYEVTPPNTMHNKLIMLNTLLFSKHIKGDLNNIRASAIKELSWLAIQLKEAKQKRYKVLLALHIPDGVNIYNTVSHNHEMVMFWDFRDSTQFRTLLHAYAPVISGMIGGHVHADGFTLYHLNNTTTIPVIFTPSFLPAFGHDSGCKNYAYTPQKLTLKKIDVFYFHPTLRNPRWVKAYTLSQTTQGTYCKDGIELLTQQNALVTNYQYSYATNLYAHENH